MKDNHKIVVVTDVTRVRLEEMKCSALKNGERKTIGGIVDKLVKDAYERISQ